MELQCVAAHFPGAYEERRLRRHENGRAPDAHHRYGRASMGLPARATGKSTLDKHIGDQTGSERRGSARRLCRQ
jgi:hypothetical protein